MIVNIIIQKVDGCNINLLDVYANIKPRIQIEKKFSLK